MTTVVVKVGSSSIVDSETGFIALGNLSRIVEKISELRRKGYKVVLVTSGAVGLGVKRLGWASRPKQMAKKQAAAAVGQGRLMRIYDDLFSQFNLTIAQVLLTRQDIGERSQYLNGKNTLKELLALDVIPIVNENDTVSVAEIKFGDNDSLSALVAGMVDATWLFLLTDVEALYTKNPRVHPDATPIHVVEDLERLKELAEISGAGSDLGTGGMETKILAATLATAAGVNTAITISSKPENILKILSGERIGTVFKAKSRTLGDRKWWIRHGLHIYGKLYLDGGAAEAVLRHNSLFAAGITKVEGTFQAQSAVSLVNAATGEEVGRAIVNYGSSEVERVKGKQSADMEKILGYLDPDCIAFRQNIALMKEDARQSKEPEPEAEA